MMPLLTPKKVTRVEMFGKGQQQPVAAASLHAHPGTHQVMAMGAPMQGMLDTDTDSEKQSLTVADGGRHAFSELLAAQQQQLQWWHSSLSPLRSSSTVTGATVVETYVCSLKSENCLQSPQW